MKKSLYILGLLLCLQQTVQAKITSCKGYYIMAAGDSISCTFDIPTDRSTNQPIYLELQKRVIAIDNGTAKKHSFGPKHLKKFVFDFDSLHIEIHSIPFGKKAKKIFVKNEATGFLTIYSYYSETEARPQDNGINFGYSPSYGNGMYSVRTGIFQNFLMQKPNEQLAYIDGLNFKASMANYFVDYPELVEKIKKGEYTKKTIRAIGEDYNQHHGK